MFVPLEYQLKRTAFRKPIALCRPTLGPWILSNALLGELLHSHGYQLHKLDPSLHEPNSTHAHPILPLPAISGSWSVAQSCPPFRPLMDGPAQEWTRASRDVGESAVYYGLLYRCWSLGQSGMVSSLWGLGLAVKASLEEMSGLNEFAKNYSTVTDLARFLGWSTSHPLRTAM